MMRSKTQTGFTLIELLVALALGVLLLGVVVTIYLGSKATFRAATGVARSQEATRFATHFLKQDIRMSGFSECSEGVSKRNFVNDDASTANTFPLSIDNGVFGWEFSGTDVGDNYDLDYDKLGNQFTQAQLNTARDNNSGAAADWSGNYIQGVPGAVQARQLPASLEALDPLKGSDILMLSISKPLNVFAEKVKNNRVPTINVVDINGDPAESEVERGAILKIGDCTALDTFQNLAAATDPFVTAEGSGVQPGNLLTGTFKWQKKWDDASRIYETTTSVYYVGTGASGKPSLFRYETSCGLNGGCGAAAEELVEGVESMQILYGENTDAGTDSDTVVKQRQRAADVYRSADDVEDFRNVVSVKLGLLLRSPEVGTDDTTFPTRDLLDQITIDPPDDQFQRFVNNSTVRLHNRGL